SRGIRDMPGSTSAFPATQRRGDLGACRGLRWRRAATARSARRVVSPRGDRHLCPEPQGRAGIGPRQIEYHP
ncbi:MAG TPA: hypothetical protein VGA04_00540, partial [Streptosporangiaceae bacterium]